MTVPSQRVPSVIQLARTQTLRARAALVRTPKGRDRGEGKDSKWTEIGVAFPHKDGKGFDILFDVVPLSGRLTIRVPSEKKN
jgi:hypothetical protein